MFTAIHLQNTPPVVDFKHMYDAHIIGAIHRCTKGLSEIDESYPSARVRALGAGMMWGASHRLTPANIRQQVLHFLKHAAPAPQTLLALEYNHPCNSIAEVETFMRTVEGLARRKMVLRVRPDMIAQVMGSQVHDYLGSCRLWCDVEDDIQASWEYKWLADRDSLSYFHNIQTPTLEDIKSQWAGYPEPPYVPFSGEVHTWVQATLNMLGREPKVEVDGRHTREIKDAIASYQLDYDLTITGTANQETVEHLTEGVRNWNIRRRK